MEQSEERLTSLGGLVVLEETAQALPVWKRVDEPVKGPGSGAGYQSSEFVQPRVWMLHAGGRRLEDLREWRAEQEVLKELGLRAVPDAGTVGDGRRRQGEEGVAGLERVNRELIQKALEPEGEELILDVEATEMEAEKQEAKWTYPHVQGDMPRVGYVHGIGVGYEFREGNARPGAGILAFAQKCEAVLPEEKRVYFRSDSAAYQAEGINPYRPPGRTFTITADLDVAVKGEIKNLPETAWKPYRTADDIATDREIAETVHTRNGTKQACRWIVLRGLNPQPNLFEAERYGYHAVATNREESAAEVIWKHNGRGNSENGHKERKVGVGMEQMPCGQKAANALYFAIGVLAYNLAQLLKRRVLPAPYATATLATLRWKVYRLAGKRVRHARGVILQIKADTEKWLLLQSARLQCAWLRS
jgi:hypothetical protein